MALQQERAGGIVNLQYVGMLFSLMFGFFIFNEIHPQWSIAGMLLIILGIIFNFAHTRYKNSKKALPKTI
jgi:drug/metabolite transporter (DMT)-like permease